MKNKDMLNMLIQTNEDLEKRNCLTPTGKAYLEGLKKARDIIFPTKSKKSK